MKRLLVTGATGTIGKALSTHLATTNNYNLVLTARAYKHPKPLGKISKKNSALYRSVKRGESTLKNLSNRAKTLGFNLVEIAS